MTFYKNRHAISVAQDPLPSWLNVVSRFVPAAPFSGVPFPTPQLRLNEGTFKILRSKSDDGCENKTNLSERGSGRRVQRIITCLLGLTYHPARTEGLSHEEVSNDANINRNHDRQPSR